SREKPADRVLRETFKRYRVLAPFETAEISKLVFSYHRWQKWLSEDWTLEDKLRRVTDFATRVETAPASFSREELRANAVPGWAREEVPGDENWLRALQREPNLWLRARRGQGKTLSNKLGNCRAAGEGALADTLQYVGEEDLFRT